MHYLMEHCRTAFELHHSMFAALFVAGLVGGLTHCAGMCGPFVMAQVQPFSRHPDGPILRKLSGAALWPYHLGRMTTYGILGMVAAFMAQQIIGMPAQRGVAFAFLALAGIIFMLSAFPQLKKKLNMPCHLPLPRAGTMLAKLTSPLLRQAGTVRGYALGILLGFMPCGLVFAALMVVSTTGNPLAAGLAMACFAAGTIPALWAVGLGGQFAFRMWPRAMQGVTRVVMVANGIALLILAGNAVA